MKAHDSSNNLRHGEGWDTLNICLLIFCKFFILWMAFTFRAVDGSGCHAILAGFEVRNRKDLRPHPRQIPAADCHHSLPLLASSRAADALV